MGPLWIIKNTFSKKRKLLPLRYCRLQRYNLIFRVIARLMQKDKPTLQSFRRSEVTRVLENKIKSKETTIYFGKNWEGDVFPTYQFIHDEDSLKQNSKEICWIKGISYLCWQPRNGFCSSLFPSSQVLLSPFRHCPNSSWAKDVKIVMTIEIFSCISEKLPPKLFNSFHF